MKATCTEHYFPVVPLIVLCKVVHVFELVDEILKCDHSFIIIHMKATKAVLFCGTVYCAVQGGSNFLVCG